VKLTLTRPATLKLFVQRCYEAVTDEESKAAIEQEMKQVSPLSLFSHPVDHYRESAGRNVMDNGLGFNACT